MNIKQLVKTILLLVLLTGCSSTSKAFYQINDGKNLLIQQDDLPVSWQLQTSWGGPFGDDATEWRKLYIHSEYSHNSIVSSATIFEEENTAIQFWEEEYVPMQAWSSKTPCLTSLEQSVRSHLADQLEFLCFDSNGSIEQMIAYEYFVIARYGNVVSTFGAVVVEGDNLTIEQANQLGVLRQTDMEALLMLLDKKFQQANSN